MNTYKKGYLAFFLSGICAMSSGVVVSLLQERYGFDYGYTGTLLALMNVGNLLASFLAGVLPARIGVKKTVLILCSGYTLGYLAMGTWSVIPLLCVAFLLLGLAKGCALNRCTILVSDNVPDRMKGMNLLHASYACGALIGPILISVSMLFTWRLPMWLLAVVGAAMWGVLLAAGVSAAKRESPCSVEDVRDMAGWTFLQSRKFWLITGLIFCQNAAETSVTGWMVTYYKGSGILSGAISNYTITIMWGATLIARLLIAFVFPIRNRFKALAVMGIGCSVLYVGLVLSSHPVVVLALLFLFSFSMAGVNPTGVAAAGTILSARSVGVMLPAAATGGILFPWLIGMVAQSFGLRMGMAVNVLPCVGIFLLSFLCGHLHK